MTSLPARPETPIGYSELVLSTDGREIRLHVCMVCSALVAPHQAELNNHSRRHAEMTKEMDELLSLARETHAYLQDARWVEAQKACEALVHVLRATHE